MVPLRRSPCSSASLALTLVSVLPAQDRELAADVAHALDQARPALLSHLRVATEGMDRAGLLALLTLAALHDGVPADAPHLQAALVALAGRAAEECYDLALRLCVYELLPKDPARQEQSARDLRALLARQHDDGGFCYRERMPDWDLSNSQYAALGLRAAVALGHKVERRVWTRLAAAVRDLQSSYGGFGYRPGDGSGSPGGYASMTAAGIAVLAICDQQLANRSFDKEIGRGWQWFARNVASVGSRDERHSFYFHYGLERAAILCDVAKVGEVDWYAQGARMLVKEQLANGGWRSAADGMLLPPREAGPGDPVATAFAVLFLRRSFQKEAGAITAHVVGLANLGPHSPERDIALCAAQLVARGKAALPEVLQALRSDVGPQRRAAGAALARLAGQDFAYDAGKDADGNRAAIRAAELWYLRNR